MTKTKESIKFNNDIAKRIKKLVKYLDLTLPKFAKNCGISNYKVIELWFEGETGPTAISLNKILKAYPGLGHSWLYFGEGEMWPNGDYFQNRLRNIGNKQKTLKEKLEALMEVYDCTQKQLAERLNIHIFYLRDISQGKQDSLSFQNAFKASKKTGLPVEWFNVE